MIRTSPMADKSHRLQLEHLPEYNVRVAPDDDWAPRKSRNVPYSDEEFAADITRLRKSWRKYRKSRSRRAIYRMLAEIYDMVTVWQSVGRAEQRCLRAM